MAHAPYCETMTITVAKREDAPALTYDFEFEDVPDGYSITGGYSEQCPDADNPWFGHFYVRKDDKHVLMRYIEADTSAECEECAVSFADEFFHPPPDEPIDYSKPYVEHFRKPMSECLFVE